LDNTAEQSYLTFKKKKKKGTSGQVWWFLPVILALRSWRQEDSKFKASLSYISVTEKKKADEFFFFSKWQSLPFICFC
jgi:hypothetical protein